MDSSWSFEKINVGVRLRSHSDADDLAVEALAELINAEIGTDPENLKRYRRRWVSVSTDSSNGLSGNATRQNVEGSDVVVLESMYSGREPVRISKRQFEDFLDQYAGFLSKQ